MSKDIDYKVAKAFYSGENKKFNNTQVICDKETKERSIYLFGNKIAWTEQGYLYINLCGWNTLTTRSRLNALDGVYLNTKQGQLFLNSRPIEDDKTYFVRDFR